MLGKGHEVEQISSNLVAHSSGTGLSCAGIRCVQGVFHALYRSCMRKGACVAMSGPPPSDTRSLTRSQARSLLSIARLKIARSRLDPAISRRTRMDQTCFGSRGFFWPMSNPLFQGRRPLLIERIDIGGAPPSRPPLRSIASVSLILVADPY
jgi:hypothetical protein